MRNYTFTLVCLLSLCACGDDVPATEASDKDSTVEFTIYTEVERTRSGVVDSYLDIESVGVYGFSQGTDEPFLENESLELRRRSWHYAEPLLWADYNSLPTIFFAYSPLSSPTNGLSVERATSSFLLLNYVVPAHALDHPYIMVAFPELCDEGYNDCVGLVMQHPLCVVAFESAIDNIVSIELEGVGVSSQLLVDVAGAYRWQEPTTMGSVASLLEQQMMMIPQRLGDNSLLRVTFDDNTTREYSLEGEVWGANKRVNYTIAVDSLIPSTRRREPNL